MRSFVLFGRHKDQPQPPTPALVPLVLTISLLKPLSASALHFDNPCFMFPDGFETHNHLAHQQNGRLNGISGRATYFSKVHFWDKATGDVVDCVTQYTAGTDTQQENAFGDDFASISDRPVQKSKIVNLCKDGDRQCEVIIYSGIMNLTNLWSNGQPKTYAVTFDATSLRPSRGHLPHPDSDCVAVNINRRKSTWGVVVPFIGTHSNFRADVQRAITKVMLDGSSSSITYDPRTKCLSVVWRDADGSSSNEIRRRYCAHSSRAYMPERVGVCVLASPESPLEYRFAQIWELSSASQLQVEKATDSWLKWPFTVMAGVVVLVAIIVAWVRSANLTEEFGDFNGLKRFTFRELRIATDSFSPDRILGQGDSGTVYKAYMGEARTPVAVKEINSWPDQAKREYISEGESLSQLRHRNLVQLIGHCHEAKKYVLVYEFMREGSLWDHLFKGGPLLPWEKRYTIALGLASAVHYLHKEGTRYIIHRDIKSSNIMLNENFEAKLGDFGTAMLVDHNEGPKATEPIGTGGYMAPECYLKGELSKKSDVYGFGVVLLEIVCGREVLRVLYKKSRNLVQWVWQRYGRRSLGGRGSLRWRENFLHVVDQRLSKDFDKEQAEALLIVGLWCAHPIAGSRPSIEEAMDVLNFKKKPPKLPPKMPKI